jgi:hypothetical protein
MSTKSFGIMLVKEYRKILDEIFRDALYRARAQVSALKIEEKAWEILERSDIFRRRRQVELQIDKIHQEKMKFQIGSCTGEPSPWEKAKAEAAVDSERMAWEKIGRVDLFEKNQVLREREKALAKERAQLNDALSQFKTMNSSYHYSEKPYDVAYKEIKNTEEERAWGKLGKEDLNKKEKELEESLAQIADEEKPYNGNVCEMKRRIDRSFFERHAPHDYKSPLDEARWQAKELLYPQETELLEARQNADQELVLAGVPEKVGEIVQTLRKTIESIIK